MARADHTRKKAVANANDAAYALIATHVDAAHYRAYNPDVAAADAEPAQHYWLTGWREGRDPNAWFSTDYYLRANPDVRASGVNPLWHFMASGQREGRLPRPAGAAWHDELHRARPYRERPIERRHADAPMLDVAALQALVGTACVAARGLVVAFSHDRYTEVAGGTQLLIADEQRKFNGDGAVYLHLSPLEARFGLAPPSPAPHLLSIILDGAVQGVATAGAAALALADLDPRLPRLLVVHALHGHRPEAVAAIARAVRPLHAFLWTHDYGAACESPQLLRNDIAFCHAPPPDSLACGVCVHGVSRREHLARMRALLDAVPFHVVAPSRVAAAQWQRGTALPAASLRVHPHARLEPRAAQPQHADGPVRVAFVGHPVFRKGWTVFRDLVGAAAATGAYRFHQFASAQDLAHLTEVTGVAAETTPLHPFGMTRALDEHRIDLVLALSPWPETFGYVAHEALAAGCDVIALAGSGALAELVRATGRGLVLDDPAALLVCFTSLHAAHHASARRSAGSLRATLVHCGSTATIGRDAEADPLTTDPDLHLVADGERLDGVHRSDTWRFALPHARAGAGMRVRLRSRHMRPAWDNATTGDARRLGVAVTALTLDGARVENDDPRRETGWHAAEPGWQWTDGDATLATGTATTLDVSLVRIARYWHAPLFGAAPR